MPSIHWLRSYSVQVNPNTCIPEQMTSRLSVFISYLSTKQDSPDRQTHTDTSDSDTNTDRDVLKDVLTALAVTARVIVTVWGPATVRNQDQDR